MLFASKKIQTVGTVREFLNPSSTTSSKKDFVPLIAAGSALPLFLHTMPTFSFAEAATTATTATTASTESIKQDVSQKIITAFDPLTDLVGGLSYPLAFLAFSAAGIYWMLGNREKAVQMMQGASIGYIIVHLSPMLMRLLVSVTAGF
ncbi:hypothetical protein QU577_27020 [Priestia megaterium]|uniref:hypothetical protein n=1 Tax=Priestia megaterium TaxID=1404 RepID=UPI0025B13505|nr:hypothetical protein [Priestia megaterium]MDN3365419.1 hypothetical protein [Priestia megaterium]